MRDGREEPVQHTFLFNMYLTPREKKRGKPAIIMRDGDGISFYCCFFVGGSVLVFFLAGNIET